MITNTTIHKLFGQFLRATNRPNDVLGHIQNASAHALIRVGMLASAEILKSKIDRLMQQRPMGDLWDDLKKRSALMLQVSHLQNEMEAILEQAGVDPAEWEKAREPAIEPSSPPSAHSPP